MTVDELRTVLDVLPGDLEVVTEGCDCTGNVRWAYMDDIGGRVLLLRDEFDGPVEFWDLKRALAGACSQPR